MLQAIGLLLLTGVFWGCTNPFIRQGTKGLRDVRARGWLGQAWAEVSFLLECAIYTPLLSRSGSYKEEKSIMSVKRLTRWKSYKKFHFKKRYVVPWLVNQMGSLVYLAAIQRAPLSVAVPTANSAAFALTALTGAAIGTEQPLDARSILGIVLIVAGTALCCWDKS